jgi:hypothetical protein
MKNTVSQGLELTLQREELFSLLRKRRVWEDFAFDFHSNYR